MTDEKDFDKIQINDLDIDFVKRINNTKQTI